MMTTLKKAIVTATKKALLSDLKQLAKPSLTFDHGEDTATASSTVATAASIHNIQ